MWRIGNDRKDSQLEYFVGKSKGIEVWEDDCNGKQYIIIITNCVYGPCIHKSFTVIILIIITIIVVDDRVEFV